MMVQEIFDAVDNGLAEVSRKLASGELDGSGRFFTDEELAAGAATGLLTQSGQTPKNGTSGTAPAA